MKSFRFHDFVSRYQFNILNTIDIALLKLNIFRLIKYITQTIICTVFILLDS